MHQVANQAIVARGHTIPYHTVVFANQDVRIQRQLQLPPRTQIYAGCHNEMISRSNDTIAGYPVGAEPDIPCFRSTPPIQHPSYVLGEFVTAHCRGYSVRSEVLRFERSAGLGLAGWIRL